MVNSKNTKVSIKLKSEFFFLKNNYTDYIKGISNGNINHNRIVEPEKGEPLTGYKSFIEKAISGIQSMQLHIIEENIKT